MKNKQQNRIVFGYNRDVNNQVVLYPEQANIVKAIFAMYQDGSSLSDIAASLGRREIPSPLNKDNWGCQTVRNILANPKYMGSRVYPRIIEDAVYNHVEQLLHQREGKTHAAGNDLSGLIVCGECGRHYRRVTRHSGEAVWRCANRVEQGKRICKESPTIQEAALKVSLEQAIAELGTAEKAVDIPQHISKITVVDRETIELAFR